MQDSCDRVIFESQFQDEAGVAAYKTVELDDHLGGGPVQYREVKYLQTNAPPVSQIPNGSNPYFLNLESRVIAG